MTQTSKKSSAPKAVTSPAKTASAPATKAAAAALHAVTSTRNSAESLLKIGTDTAKEFFASSTEEAQKAHEKFFAAGRGGTENISRGIEAFTKTLNDFVALTRENADAAIEVNHIVADIAKSINSEIVSCANANFSDNVELAQETFACRDINDAVELYNKFLTTNLENYFTQTTRLAEMLFQLATEAAEPINERVAEATERFSKSLAA